MVALLQHALLRSAALLVPALQRAEWLAEWRSEAWYSRREFGAVRATGFCFGAFYDALWFWKNGAPFRMRELFHLGSPTSCLGFLMTLASASLLVAYRIPDSPTSKPTSAPWFWLILAVASVMLSPTSLFANYRANRLLSRATRLRRWWFLAAKIALIMLTSFAPMRYISYAGTQDPQGGSVGFVVQVTVWGMLFALRWSLKDQGKRCPVCLRLLGNPVRVGEPAGYFLEWNCTELVCIRGHGMLYVPECHTSWFDTPRWFYLDSTY